MSSPLTETQRQTNRTECRLAKKHGQVGPQENHARMAERPHVQRVNADRKTNTAEMLARPPKR